VESEEKKEKSWKKMPSGAYIRLSRATAHVARLSLATLTAWPLGFPTWQLGVAKACGATLHRVTP